MILSDKKINSLIDAGEIVIEPKPEIKKAAVKLHLSGEFGEEKEELKNTKRHILEPKSFILASTKERVKLPQNIAAFYDGHISMATKGVMTHMGSMFINPEFEGKITLEIFNASDKKVELTENMRVGHLILLQIAQ